MSIQNPGAEKLQTGNLEHLPVSVLGKEQSPRRGGNGVAFGRGSAIKLGLKDCLIYE